MLADGRMVQVSRRENRELFRASCGGMGLTGVILTATLQLQRVPSAYIQETTFRARNLEEVCRLFEEQQDRPYSVAWIDCLARGEDLGRSLLMVGDFAPEADLSLPSCRAVSVPLELPDLVLNKFSMQAFNFLYYRRVRPPVRHRRVNLLSFFYPLDAIGHWNRLYGKRGFTQYQLVLPKEAGLKGLGAILTRVAASRFGASLGTLKLFGPENDNYLSFPLEGYTLAMDFKMEPGLFAFLGELDRLVLDHGGRLYLTKDVRMPAAIFRRGYPRWEKFLALREKWGLRPKFNSLQSRRLEI
jgi:decaprenylphospho-beta-D-ribofuranose 2-oxidase